mmetsp:Transcript_608/g.1432  ORF Transcript_608/g.1432 Transcript_608/m.1432 type:complete len:215 (-) Transcript_608:418-1062(-)
MQMLCAENTHKTTQVRDDAGEGELGNISSYRDEGVGRGPGDAVAAVDWTLPGDQEIEAHPHRVNVRLFCVSCPVEDLWCGVRLVDVEALLVMRAVQSLAQPIGCHLEHVVLGEEEVDGLQVPVYDWIPAFVQKAHRPRNVNHPLHNLPLGRPPWFPEHFSLLIVTSLNAASFHEFCKNDQRLRHAHRSKEHHQIRVPDVRHCRDFVHHVFMRCR